MHRGRTFGCHRDKGSALKKDALRIAGLALGPTATVWHCAVRLSVRLAMECGADSSSNSSSTCVWQFLDSTARLFEWSSALVFGPAVCQRRIENNSLLFAASVFRQCYTVLLLLLHVASVAVIWFCTVFLLCSLSMQRFARLIWRAKRKNLLLFAFPVLPFKCASMLFAAQLSRHDCSLDWATSALRLSWTLIFVSNAQKCKTWQMQSPRVRLAQVKIANFAIWIFAARHARAAASTTNANANATQKTF